MQHFRRGFTLIELLVVVAIIGLLSSIVLASLNTAREKGFDAQRVSDLRSIQNALELYATSNNGRYPVVGNGSTWASQCSTWGGLAPDSVIPGLVPTDLSSMPADPQMNVGANTCCIIYKSNGTDYKLLDYDCSTSFACFGSGTANSGFNDPVRQNACALYTPGAWNW